MGVSSAPLGDFGMVTREKDFGDFHTAEISGLGVLGIFDVVTVGETFDGGGGCAT